MRGRKSTTAGGDRNGALTCREVIRASRASSGLKIWVGMGGTSSGYRHMQTFFPDVGSVRPVETTSVRISCCTDIVAFTTLTVLLAGLTPFHATTKPIREMRSSVAPAGALVI